MAPPPAPPGYAPAAPPPQAAPPGYPPQQAAPPGYPPSAVPATPSSAGPIDPHQLGLAVGRLGPSARRGTKTALIVASALLQPGEVVEAVVAGRFEGEPGAAVLTANRVLLVNEAEWKAGVISVPVRADLAVQGWQDDKVASLTFTWGESQATVESITDRPLAQEMAGRVRAKVAELGG